MSERDGGVDGRRAFIGAQVGALEPFDFVAFATAAAPSDSVHVARHEQGTWGVVVAGRPEDRPFSDEQRAAITALGLKEDGPVWTPASGGFTEATPAADLVEAVLAGPLGMTAAARVEVRHGNRRAEHEAELKLAELRTVVEPVLTALIGGPASVDDDGDYTFVADSARIYVAPRTAPGMPPIVRVFAVTNHDLPMTPELGMFLARANLGLVFGRFSLDVEHAAVWFDHTLLGEHLHPDDLRATVEAVAQTANEWDTRIAATFGGATAVSGQAPPAQTPQKPGEAGYL